MTAIRHLLQQHEHQMLTRALQAQELIEKTLTRHLATHLKHPSWASPELVGRIAGLVFLRRQDIQELKEQIARTEGPS
jgi:hypothetical protein